MIDTYLVLASAARAELKVKGSRFIAVAIPVKNQKKADDAIRRIRKRDHDATHHSTAYRLGSNADVFRFNDDGEPAGSAGKPILRQIESRELTNTLVVVTRYFGGTKLGTGGLIRAYGDVASLALDQARVQTVINRTVVSVCFDYADTSPAMQTIKRFDAKIESTRYGDQTRIRLAVRTSQRDDFVARFKDALSGRCVVDVSRPNDEMRDFSTAD